MMYVTTESIPGYKVDKAICVVSGCIAYASNGVQAISADFKRMTGGEIPGFTEVLDTARDTALSRMLQTANDLGADGVIGVRYTTSSLSAGVSEIIAYGTAVKLREKNES